MIETITKRLQVNIISGIVEIFQLASHKESILRKEQRIKSWKFF